MLVKVNTSLAGGEFSFRFGEEVEAELFASLVGNGWENLCDPVAGAALEKAVVVPVAEVAVEAPVIELAIKQPVAETTSRRSRRK